mgnify:CR=1 FL=1
MDKQEKQAAQFNKLNATMHKWETILVNYTAWALSDGILDTDEEKQIARIKGDINAIKSRLVFLSQKNGIPLLPIATPTVSNSGAPGTVQEASPEEDDIGKDDFARILVTWCTALERAINNLATLKDVKISEAGKKDLSLSFTSTIPLVAALKTALDGKIASLNNIGEVCDFLQGELKKYNTEALADAHYKAHKKTYKKYDASAFKIEPTAEQVAATITAAADKTDANHPDNIKAEAEARNAETEAEKAQKEKLYNAYETIIENWVTEERRLVAAQEQDTSGVYIDCGCLDASSSEVTYKIIPKGWKDELLENIVKKTNGEIRQYDNVSSPASDALKELKEKYIAKEFFEALNITEASQLQKIRFPINIREWLFNCDLKTAQVKETTTINIKAILKAVLKLCLKIINKKGPTFKIKIGDFILKIKNLLKIDNKVDINNILNIEQIFGDINSEITIQEFYNKIEVHINNISDTEINNFYIQNIAIYNTDVKMLFDILMSIQKKVSIIENSVTIVLPPNPIQNSEGNIEGQSDTLQYGFTFKMNAVKSFLAPSEKIKRYVNDGMIGEVIGEVLDCVSNPLNCAAKHIKNWWNGNKKAKGVWDTTISDFNLMTNIPVIVKNSPSGVKYACVENNSDISINITGGGHYKMSGTGVLGQVKNSGKKSFIQDIELTVTLQDPDMEVGDSVSISFVVGEGSNSYSICKNGEFRSATIKMALVSTALDNGSVSAEIVYEGTSYGDAIFLSSRIASVSEKAKKGEVTITPIK